MAKLLGFGGMVIAGLIAILFVADLAVGIPFERASLAVDIGFIVASLIVAYLSWSIVERPRAG
ncbi:MAG: hypothetical protein RLZZ21_2371 [Planctomycetota bacterium]|jgi:hypothetical protein